MTPVEINEAETRSKENDNAETEITNQTLPLENDTVKIPVDEEKRGLIATQGPVGFSKVWGNGNLNDNRLKLL